MNPDYTEFNTLIQEATEHVTTAIVQTALTNNELANQFKPNSKAKTSNDNACTAVNSLQSVLVQIAQVGAKAFQYINAKFDDVNNNITNSSNELTKTMEDNYGELMVNVDGVSDLIDERHQELLKTFQQIQHQINKLSNALKPNTSNNDIEAARWIINNAKTSDGSNIKGQTITIERVAAIIAYYKQFASD